MQQYGMIFMMLYNMRMKGTKLLQTLTTTGLVFSSNRTEGPVIKWIQKTKIMASGPITSWEIDGETVETVSDFILGGSKITAEHEAARQVSYPAAILSKHTNPLKGEVQACEYHTPTPTPSQTLCFV